MKQGVISIFLATLCGGTPIEASTLIASATWSSNGHEYGLVELQGATWEEALADLSVNYPSAYLATATTPEENAFIASGISSDVFGQWWLGGLQIVAKPETDPNEGWQWVTGETWAYTNWNPGPGEPNNAGGFEDHLGIYTTSGFWNDEGSAIVSVQGYVYEIAPIPLPAGLGLLVGALAMFPLVRRRVMSSSL